METITDIIGAGKIFEPPFRVLHGYDHYIADSKNRTMVIIDYTAIEDKDCRLYYKRRTVIAQHLCDLLNKEHCNG